MSGSGTDTAADALLRDPQYLLKLHRRLAQCLCSYDASTHARVMSAAFTEVDSKYRARERVQSTDLWLLKGVLRQIFSVKLFSDRELQILLSMLPLHDYEWLASSSANETRVSPVALLLCLRQLHPFRVTMLYRILQTMDARSPKPHPCESQCGRTIAFHAQDEKDSECTFDTTVLVDHLTQLHGLTLSEALFVLDYCRSGSCSRTDSLTIDGPRMYKLLYQRPLPSTVHFTLVISVFTEAICDPNRDGSSGTLALIQDLQRVPLTTADDCLRVSALQPSVDVDEKTLNSFLTLSSFEQLCMSLKVGLGANEILQLFTYLRDDGSTELVSVRTLLHEFTLHFATVGESMFAIALESVRGYVVKQGGMLSLPRLLITLPKGELPITKFVASLRQAGVPEVVSDVEVEWLRFRARDGEQLVTLLCGRCPTSREALIKQLFSKIKNPSAATNGDALAIDHVLTAFQPEKVSDLLTNTEEWRHVMACFLGECVTFARFAFFWACVSAACPDDSVFTMMLWRCFNMHTKP
ncbi:hypothetical protein ERJ75_000930300 [Trypanosoma vivax]|uniref:Uncharacterized protein n=1 Tax=Trypanosoma vivax (strain Y486) TaxID=1055687 RepID=G0U410_TRYVY|nr:hypothetical protein TRVL_08740 [Trypanosoma vivax]KAH8612101.1 hypothetical protein ERJ75_000930300 [Trypanosoma vivax]CCC52172.1 conserved hypothetical protein [Trypanosoma vivax Y486]